MKKYYAVLFILINSVLFFAQTNQFTTEDVIKNAYGKLAPDNFKQISWINSENISIVEKNDTSEVLYSYDIAGKVKNKIMDLSEFKNIYSTVSKNQLLAFPSIGWLTKSRFSFFTDSSYYNLDLSDKSVTVINNHPADAEEVSISPNRKFLAYTIENNLFVNLAKDEKTQITFDGKYGIVNGNAVHRNEFGIEKGIFWSPDSRKIAFYRMDETMVTDYPLVDISTIPASLDNIKYPMAGQTSHEVKIGIYDIENKTTTWLNIEGPKDQYLTCVTWDPDSKFIYSAILNRDQNHFKLTKYDVNSGDKVKVLFEESNDKFVEPENQMFFIPKSDGEFLWLSKRDGWNHLYRYDASGKLINKVTSGEWEVISTDGFSTDGKYVYITSTIDSPLERQYLRIEINSGKIKKLTSDPGTHNVNSGPSKKYFFDNFNSTSVPGEIRVFDNNGNLSATLLKSDNPLKDYALGKSEINTLTAEDGTKLFYNLILPPDFDETRKYPVVVYVYGGPHVQLITNSFPYGRYEIWFREMAQKGFIVFILDNRGSANRGLAFEQATFRNLGTKEIEDQLAGVKYLKSLSYVDSTRLGVFGWSYGGFMATSLMLRTNNTFKVGVAGGAVINWELYEVMYTERYMDTPQTNYEGYEKANLLNYVENLQGKLLMVHGTNDPTVPWQNTLLFAQKAAHLNRPLDYYPYPGHGHGIRGNDAIHLYNKLTQYFIDNL